MSSSELTRLLPTLTPEAQQIIFEKHFLDLLNLAPKEKAEEVLSAATRLQKKHNDAPKLDLRAKRKQINALFDELSRDAKVAFIKERSNRDELLAEVVHSLTSWLNDIWLSVYEYNVNFLLAHSCLVFVADALTQLSESSSLGGCKCSVMNLPVEFALRDRKGKVVKRFSVMGPQNMDRILLWVWRDLFVALYAKGSERDKRKVPDFLEDIEAAFGVMALEWLLYGGKRRLGDDEGLEDGEDYYDSEEEDEDDYSVFGEVSCNGDDDDDEEGSEYDSDESIGCTCNFHASYWSQHINRERGRLKECVEKRLMAVFKVTPSLRLYNTILAISSETLFISLELSRTISKIAGDTPDNLVAALDISIANGDAAKIVSLLDSHAYLLRPRDAITLQCAVAMLEDSAYTSRSVAILEKELSECLRSTYVNVRACFSLIEEEANKKELSEIIKLRSSSTRQDRIVAWVDRVTTPNTGPLHPMAFAAMMMGLPMLPGGDDPDDGDFLNFLDLESNDEDLEDLRDEFRPNLKAIFNGWVHLGQSVKGGGVVLAKIYLKALEQMPWLAGSDIVAEMVNKLRERPNKNHVLEALSNLSAFAKIQRKKLKLAREQQQRRTASKVSSPSQTPTSTSSTFTSTSRSTTGTANAPAASSSSSTSYQPLASLYTSSSPRPESPPPPLEPLTPPRGSQPLPPGSSTGAKSDTPPPPLMPVTPPRADSPPLSSPPDSPPPPLVPITPPRAQSPPPSSSSTPSPAQSPPQHAMPFSGLNLGALPLGVPFSFDLGSPTASPMPTPPTPPPVPGGLEDVD